MGDRAKPLDGTVPDDAFDVAVDMLSREQRRSRRKRDVRARTISIRRISKRELLTGRSAFPEVVARPKRRGDCEWCATCQEFRDAEIWNHRAARVSGLGDDDPALHQPEEPGLQTVRRAGDSGLPSLASQLSGLSGGHGASTERSALGREDRQQRPVRSGELRLGNAPTTESKPPVLRLADRRQSDAAHDGLGEGAQHSGGDDPQTPEARLGRLPCGHDASQAHFRSRPCAFVGCKFNLFLDVSATGALKTNFPDLEPEEAADSCCLDVAEEGGASLERVGECLNVVRERIRQVEVKAFRLLRQLNDDKLEEHADGERSPFRVHQESP
jgi:hypothetical protein